ncbi:hypothetical protein AB0J55_06240 [Amycolatopsis sp. NPDC049688]|uniref:hypothetical protein n=1 Tax=Amycolatopsis sp. NPDC049688 TaxID=3154733 RepID=UPI003445CEA8
MMRVDRRGRVRRIMGDRTEDVIDAWKVVMASQQDQPVKQRSPWVSGSFYLTVFLAVVAILLVAARVLSIWVVPIIVVGGLLGVSVVGALQLRHDDRLSERGFLKLMMVAVGRLPAMLVRSPSRVQPTAEGEQGA